MSRSFSSAHARMLGALAAAGCFCAATAAMAGEYVPLPQDTGKPSALKIRLIQYSGGTNGKAIVELESTGQRPEVFVATGLYLVPNGSPESAPQRLGAAGPFELWRKDKWQHEEQITVAPGATERLRLQVFCIDSHRASPGGGGGFKIGRERLPKDLRNKIDERTKAAIKRNGGKVEQAIGEIQGEIWKSRNERWVPLDGERVNEK